jgi:hypothetical protein
LDPHEARHLHFTQTQVKQPHSHTRARKNVANKRFFTSFTYMGMAIFKSITTLSIEMIQHDSLDDTFCVCKHNKIHVQLVFYTLNHQITILHEVLYKRTQKLRIQEIKVKR